MALDSQDSHTITTIINDFAKHALRKYEAGQREHGGTLVTKGGLLWESEQEAIDLVIYQHAVRTQLERVAATLASGRHAAARAMIDAMLHGSSRQTLPE